MPRKKLKKVLPTHEKIKEQKFLKFLGKWMHKQEIWSLRRSRIVLGVFIGIFCACLPMPFQMVLAAALAIIFHANLPISVALVWISNPITMPPLFYFEYEVGKFLLNDKSDITFDYDSMTDNFDAIATNLYFGSVVVGLISAILCALAMHFIWIRTVRKERRESPSNNPNSKINRQS